MLKYLYNDMMKYACRYKASVHKRYVYTCNRSVVKKKKKPLNSKGVIIKTPWDPSQITRVRKTRPVRNL